MSLLESLAEGVLIWDGAMGTQIQAANLSDADFTLPKSGSEALFEARTRLGDQVLDGCNELLNLTRPDAIEAIHRRYIEAGAQLIETNHFGIYHLVNGGSCSRYEFACEILRQAGRAHIPVTPITHTEWVRASTPPLRALLANTNAAALGITLRPWPEALATFFQTS